MMADIFSSKLTLLSCYVLFSAIYLLSPVTPTNGDSHIHPGYTYEENDDPEFPPEDGGPFVKIVEASSSMVNQEGGGRLDYVPPDFSHTERVKRETLADDEDMFSDQESGSGGGSGRILPSEPSTTKPPTKPQYDELKSWYIHLTLGMTFTPALENTSSPIYKMASEVITTWIKSLFLSVSLYTLKFNDTGTAYHTECMFELELPAKEFNKKETLDTIFKGDPGIHAIKVINVTISDEEIKPEPPNPPPGETRPPTPSPQGINNVTTSLLEEPNNATTLSPQRNTSSLSTVTPVSLLMLASIWLFVSSSMLV